MKGFLMFSGGIKRENRKKWFKNISCFVPNNKLKTLEVFDERLR